MEMLPRSSLLRAVLLLLVLLMAIAIRVRGEPERRLHKLLEEKLQAAGPVASAILTTPFNLPSTLQSAIAEMPFLPVLFARAASTLHAEKPCGKDARRFLDQLGNGTIWAARMFDASAKFPEGVLFGSTDHYGNFDECYHGGIEGFGTRYCLIDVGYERRNLPSYTPLQPFQRANPSGSVWQFLSVKPGMPTTDKSMLRMALCAPASCTPNDIELSLRKSLEHKLRISGAPAQPQPQPQAQLELPFQVTVRPNYCQAFDDRPQASLATTVYCGFIVGVILVMVAGSIRYEEMAAKGEDNRSLVEGFLLCFSVQTSWRKLVKRERSDDCLDFLDGFRVMLMTLVVFAHRYFQVVQVSWTNADDSDLDAETPFNLVVANSTVAIDFFFCMTAIIVTKSWLESLQKGKPLGLLSVMLKRYRRFTPSYAVIVFFLFLVFPHTGSGSLWKAQVESEADCCRGEWWLNLLYINNYTQRVKCMFQSWYLSADFQAHSFLYLVVRFFWTQPRIRGYAFLTTLIIAASCVSAYGTHSEGLPPLWMVLFNYDTLNGERMEYLKNVKYFLVYYTKTHTRLGAFLVGALAAAIIYDLKRINFVFPKFFFNLFFRLSLLYLACLVAAWAIRYTWYTVSSIEELFYAGSHRNLFVFITSVLLISYAFSDRQDPVRRALSLPWLHPLSKLTYGIFLTHHINHMYSIGSIRSPKAFIYHDLLSDFAIDLIVAFSTSVCLWFGIESPVNQLQQLFFSGKRDKDAKKAD